MYIYVRQRYFPAKAAITVALVNDRLKVHGKRTGGRFLTSLHAVYFNGIFFNGILIYAALTNQQQESVFKYFRTLLCRIFILLQFIIIVICVLSENKIINICAEYASQKSPECSLT